MNIINAIKGTARMGLMPVLCGLLLGASAQAAAPVGSTIALKSVSSGQYVDADSGQNNRLEAISPTKSEPSQKFTVEEGVVSGSPYVRLRSNSSGDYISVDPADTSKFKMYATDFGGSTDLQEFTWIENTIDSTVSLQSRATGDYVRAFGGAKVLRASGRSIEENCKFVVEEDVVSSGAPNIVMIYIDDWAWNATSVLMDESLSNSGMPGLMQMDNLRDLALNGMMFRNAYGSPQCTPARAALQTGQSNARNEMTVHLNHSADLLTTSKYDAYPVYSTGVAQEIPVGTLSIAEHLASLGYISANYGKWHIGRSPLEMGYDASSDGNNDNRPGNTIERWHEANGSSVGEAAYFPALGSSYYDAEDPKLFSHVTDSGVAFINAHGGVTPFYLQLSHYGMHAWYECTRETRAIFQEMPEVMAYNYENNNWDGDLATAADTIRYKKDPAVWLGMVYELDQKIGEIRAAVAAIPEIADNTYIVLTGDNGYRATYFDELVGLPQPLHAEKWWAWEAGVRVPTIVTGPGIAPGSVSTENVVNYDFLPTFFEWAGGASADLPNESDGVKLAIDGLSLAALLRGEDVGTTFSDRQIYFHYPHYRASIPHSVLIQGDYKLVHFYEKEVRTDASSGDSLFSPGPMLFDLSSDLGERNNIYAGNETLADSLKDDLLLYLYDVGARIPQRKDGLNPDFPTFSGYDESAYLAALGDDRLDVGGPFDGQRPMRPDEVPAARSEAEDADRMASGINVGATDDDPNGTALFGIGNGEWIEFDNVNLSTGFHLFRFRRAADGAPEVLNATVTAYFGQQSIGTIDITGTGDAQTWGEVTAVFDVMNGGTDTLRLEVTSGGDFSLNWFDISGF